MKKRKHNRPAVQLLTLAMLAAILSGFALTALATDDGTGPPAAQTVAEKTAAETAGEGAEASPEARKAPQRAGPSDAFGTVRFIFERDGYGSDQTIKLKSYQYITECRPGGAGGENSRRDRRGGDGSLAGGAQGPAAGGAIGCLRLCAVCL